MAASLISCSKPAAPVDAGAIEAAAHGGYVTAINSNDTDKKTGVVTIDRGKVINIFRRGTDGKWPVAVDGWSWDIPAS